MTAPMMPEIAYIERIKNPAKKAYAKAYRRYLIRERNSDLWIVGANPEPTRGDLSAMAAQAVRMQIDRLMGV